MKTFTEMKDFARGSLKSYNISPSNTNIGIVNYGNNADIELQLSKGVGPVVVGDVLDQMKLKGGSRNITTALSAADSMFVSGPSSRNTTGKLLVLFVTGQESAAAEEKFEAVAASLKQKNVEIKVIRVGKKEPESILSKLVDDAADISVVPSTENFAEEFGSVEEAAGKTAGLCVCRIIS